MTTTTSRWRAFGRLPQLLAMSSPDPQQQEYRIQFIERNVGLPVRAVVLGILFYYLFLSSWYADTPSARGVAQDEVTRIFVFDVIQLSYLLYAALNIGFAFLLLAIQQVSTGVVQWTVFALALLDGLFLGALLLITGGVASSLYWVFLFLIIRNSLTVSAAVPQVMLNLLLCLFYAGGVVLDARVCEMDNEPQPNLSEPFLLKLGLAVCVAAWCYCIQVLLDRQRRSADEQHELALRREQLQAAGRLAAEIAHQLKNPLGIINNAAFTLQRTVKEGKTITQQIAIIREEVDRSDRIITELMGYAQLVEGRVERLDVKEEIEAALLRAFPPAVKYEISLHRDYAPTLPNLLAQRVHLSEVLVNLLQNAREAMNGKGNLWVSAQHGEQFSVVICIADDGPGIPKENLERIFEPYFSTRDKGTGLGLAIVKHNVEMYGGRVRVESELGKGSRFIIQYPARTLVKLRT